MLGIICEEKTKALNFSQFVTEQATVPNPLFRSYQAYQKSIIFKIYFRTQRMHS